MINRYDNYYASPRNDAYQPINFLAMYQIGQALNLIIRQAEADLLNTVAKFGEFTSPSDVDTQNYYRESIGHIRPLLDKAVSNPELMKDPAFRGELNSLIASVDYAKLARYRQSADEMRQQQLMAQELNARGLWNPNWHNVDFAGYNTDTAGSYQVTPMTPYMTQQLMMDPVMSQLKPEFIQSKGGYMEVGVSKERAMLTFMDNLPTLQAMPLYTEYKNQLIRQGYTPAAADELLVKDMANRAVLEYSYVTKDIDPVYALNAQLSERRASSGAGTNYSGNPRINITRYLNEMSASVDLANNGAWTADALERRANGQMLPEDVLVAMQGMSTESRANNYREYFVNEYNNATGDTQSKLNTATSRLAKAQRIPNISRKLANILYYNDEDAPKAGLTLPNKGDLILDQDYVDAVTGYNTLNQIAPVSGASYTFREQWNNDAFTDILTEPTLEVLAPATGEIFQTIYAYIPKEQFDASIYGSTSEDIAKAIGGKAVKRGDITFAQSSSFNDGTQSRTDRESATSKQKEYIRVRTKNPISLSGEAANMADNLRNAATMQSGKTGDTQDYISQGENF